MENKPSTFTVSLGYGLLTALAMVVFSLVMYLVGLDKNSFLMYLSYLILLAGIVLSQLNYRNKYMGGFMEYGKAFVVGLWISLIVAVITGIYTFIFFKYINPGAIDEAMSIAEKKMMDRGLSDAEVDQGMAMARKFASPGIYTFFGILGNLIFGIILSLIAAIFTKKEGQGFEQPQV